MGKRTQLGEQLFGSEEPEDKAAGESEEEHIEPELSGAGIAIFGVDGLRELSGTRMKDTGRYDKMVHGPEKDLAAFQESKEIKEGATGLKMPERIRVLFIGLKDTIAIAECGYDEIELEKRVKAAGNTDEYVRRLYEESPFFAHKECKRMDLKHEYDEATLEDMVSEKILPLAGSGFYHALVVCARNPDNSKHIVRRLCENPKLRPEEGCRLVYMIIGAVSTEKRWDVAYRNVYFLAPPGPDEENHKKFMEALSEQLKKGVKEAYTRKEQRYNVLVMGDPKPFEGIEIPNYKLTVMHVEPTKKGYQKAKEMLPKIEDGSKKYEDKKVVINGVIVDGAGKYQIRLVNEVAGHPMVAAVAVGEKREAVAAFGATPVHETSKTALRTLASAMTEKTRIPPPEEVEIRLEFTGIEYLDEDYKVRHLARPHKTSRMKGFREGGPSDKSKRRMKGF